MQKQHLFELTKIGFYEPTSASTPVQSLSKKVPFSVKNFGHKFFVRKNLCPLPAFPQLSSSHKLDYPRIRIALKNRRKFQKKGSIWVSVLFSFHLLLPIICS